MLSATFLLFLPDIQKVDMNIRTIISVASVLVAVLNIVSCSCGREDESVPEMTPSVDEQAEVQEDRIRLDSLRCVEGKIKNGQFFSTLMMSLGMTAQEAYDLTVACGSVFDVKSLRVGNSYKAYYEEGESGLRMLSKSVFVCTCKTYCLNLQGFV